MSDETNLSQELIDNLSYSGYNAYNLNCKRRAVTYLIYLYHNENYSVRQLCDIFSISIPHCYKILKENGIKFNHTLVNKN